MGKPIAFDVMSGDRGPSVAVEGIKLAIRNNPQIQIIAVGKESILKPLLASHPQVKVRHVANVVSMEDDPKHAVRRRDTSLYKATSLVADGEAAAAVSAGNTGALMITARVLLKMREPYRRPAIAAQIPCARCTDFFTMLDLGANLDRTTEMLLDFAHMGDEFGRAIRNTDRPKIALLNIGTENIKGGQELISAGQELSSSDLNYIGFIESNTLFDPKADLDEFPDVVVCDGFAGNVFLKTIEGLSAMIKGMFTDAYNDSPYAKWAGLVSLPVINSLRSTMDHRRYNGASFLGLRGLMVKAHGHSDAIGFASALGFAHKQVAYHEQIVK